MMLRGTVYTVVDDVPVRRQVLECVTTATGEPGEQIFKGMARTRILAGGGAPDGARLEFGPIGSPWHKLGLVLAILLLGASSAIAQGITSYELRVYAPGATAPTQTTPIPLSAVMCDQPVVQTPAPPIINPTAVRWTDPDNTTRDCVWLGGTGGGILPSLPPASYEGALRALNAGGASSDSNRVPFSRVNPAAAPTNLRFSSEQ